MSSNQPSSSTPSAGAETKVALGPVASDFPIWFAAVGLAMAAQVFMNVYPVMIVALGDAGRATPAQLGRMVTVEYFSMALTALFAGKYIRIGQLRLAVIAASVIQLLAVVSTTYVSGDAILPVRAVFAAACGLQVYAQYDLVSRVAKPGLLVGVCTATVVIVAIAMSWAGRHYVNPHLGVNGLIIFFGFPGVVAIIAALMLPTASFGSRPSGTDRAVAKQPLSAASVWLLISGFTWSAWISILWIYSAPMALSRGITADATEASVLVTLVGSLIGAGLGAVTSEHFSFKHILPLGLLLCAVHVIALLLGVGSAAYIALFAMFGFLGYFLVPYYVKSLIAADAEGQSVVYFPVAQYGAGGAGPFVASFAVSAGEYRGGLIVDLLSIVIAIGSLGIALLVIRRRRSASG